MESSNNMQCPCQSGETYASCCERFISGKEKPETAEQLMRARYSAYTQAEMEFIEQTHDPKTRKDLNMEANRKWAESATWHGLEIISTDQGGPEDDTGYVEFVARYDLPDEGPQEHRELSEFNRRQGQWVFTDSKNPQQQTYVREEKVGRNDPCPCGSGKKYKKCCAT